MNPFERDIVFSLSTIQFYPTKVHEFSQIASSVDEKERLWTEIVPAYAKQPTVVLCLLFPRRWESIETNHVKGINERLSEGKKNLKRVIP